MALPLVLVGPIVRRVDSDSASVFIALSRQATVELRIWEGVQEAQPGQPGVTKSGLRPVNAGTTRTRRFGESLHVAVVVAPLIEPLLPNERYSYDLVMTTAAGTTGLRDNGLLAEVRVVGSDPEAPVGLPIGYGPDRLPGFQTCPASLDKLRVVQASCRRTEKPGDDAMAYIDDLIGGRIAGIQTSPPHQLVLTGDQIYADGLAAPLLPAINALGREMLGGQTEQLPLAGGQSLEADVIQLPPLHRQRICSLDAKFSGREGHSHVFSLAEFYALYALSFSTSVWRAIPGAEGFPDLSPVNDLHRSHLTDWERRLPAARVESQMRKLRAQWADQTQALRVFRAALPKVARVLANVPTYMLFDDHDVSDDWNLTAVHRRRTIASPFGRRVILNALSAATVFQAWGNDPLAFDPPPSAPTVNGRLLNAIADRDLDTATALLGLQTDLADVPVRFGFTVDGPVHRLLAIDTRNHRDFPSDTGPPALVRREQIDDQVPEGPLPSGLQVLMVLSPAPVVHPALVDSIAQPIAAGLIDVVGAVGEEVRRTKEEVPDEPEGRHPDDFGLTGSSKTEVELWYGDRDAFDHLLERLSTYPRVVILSGDVHFSVSLALDTWLTPNLPGASSRIVQLTGSAARNHWGPGTQLVLRAFRPFQELLGLAVAPDFRTTLTVALEAATTAASIAVATPAPSALAGSAFMIRIDDELLLATAGAGGASPWAVQRGARGSAPAAHAEGATVRHVSLRGTQLKWNRSDVAPVEGVVGRRPLELKLKENPVRVPALGWPQGAVQRRPADFVVRLALLSDERPDAVRSTQLGSLLAPFAEIDPVAPFDGYAATLQRHQAGMRNSAQVRTLVYPHNISELSFAVVDGELRVAHEIYARLEHADAGVRGEMLARHETSLDPVADPRPAIELEAGG